MELANEVKRLIDSRLNNLTTLSVICECSVPTLRKALKGELTNKKTLNHLKVKLENYSRLVGLLFFILLY